MTPEQGRSLALLVLTTIALGSLPTVTSIADPAAALNPVATTEKASAGGAGEHAVKPSASKSTSATTSSVKEIPGQKALLTGQVIPLHEALLRKKIKSYTEEAKGQYVLELESGELLPIIADGRGRAFYQDERLRNRRVTVLAIRRPQIPFLQVVSIYTYDESGQAQLTDYWCDICAIPMYEIKKCECCQGPTRLRFQKKELPKVEGIAN